ncbi:MAG: response regulator, partial [Pseudomonadota bacterium]
MNNETNKARTDKILIVDDTPANLQLLTNLLKEQGYLAYPASDGELALEFVRFTLPDLILLDIKMPGTDGYEVCRRLKADDQTRSIPIIFISVLENERDKVEAFQAGSVDYITKPIRSEEVLARVNTHLALRHAQLELEARNAELETARNTLEERVRERSSELEQVNHTLREEINRHIQTLKALRESEARYRRIVDTANEGVWVIEPDSQTVSVNGRMAEMLGYTPEEIIGRLFTDFMFEEDIPDHLRQIENRRQGIGDQYERRLRHREGRTVWTLASATPLLDEQRGFEGSFAMFTDITEHKGAEEALRESRQRLDNIVANSPGAIYRCANDEHWTMEFIS